MAPLTHESQETLRTPVLSPRHEEVRAIVEQAGAVRRGHFVLASKRHSDTYVEKFRILERPDLLDRVCRELAAPGRELAPQVVAGPSTGGMIVAYEVARQLGLPSLYVELEGDRRILKRGASLDPGARVLLVDDVLTTGVSLRETLAALQEHGGDVVGIGVLIDRSEAPLSFPCEIHAACRFEARTYAPEEVPDWLSQIPITTPGTRAGKGA